MNKYILGLLAIGLLAGGIFFGIKNKKITDIEVKENINDIELVSTSTEISLENKTAETTSEPKILSVADKAWDVLQKYISFAQKHNLEGVKNLSYQLSSDCKDPSKTKECNARMDTAYAIGSELKRKDFGNIWSDSKQIILTTDLTRQESTTTLGYVKGIIYFVVENNGDIKFLSLNPMRGYYLEKKDFAIEKLESDLQKQTTDSDKDGIEDEIEKCNADVKEPCQKTNPEKRDTDGDGFWDGIEALFYK